MEKTGRGLERKLMQCVTLSFKETYITLYISSDLRNQLAILYLLGLATHLCANVRTLTVPHKSACIMRASDVEMQGGECDLNEKNEQDGQRVWRRGPTEWVGGGV